MEMGQGWESKATEVETGSAQQAKGGGSLPRAAGSIRHSQDSQRGPHFAMPQSSHRSGKDVYMGHPEQGLWGGGPSGGSS